jgi:hypothetical protein
MEDRWPDWARAQLRTAVALASAAPSGRVLAVDLYERWYSPGAQAAAQPPTRPLLGEYRRAHAAVATRVIDGVAVLERQDRIGRDGWWRTWNTAWRPAADGSRVLLSPRVDDAPELVGELTRRLRDVPYLLACPTDAVRLGGSGSVVLYVAQPAALTPDVVTDLAPLLRADTPPLCLPLGRGIAVAQYPDNGMTFGEHRCHLVALALARRDVAEAARDTALHTIAEVFRANGVDPAAPYRTALRR